LDAGQSLAIDAHSAARNARARVICPDAKVTCTRLENRRRSPPVEPRTSSTSNHSTAEPERGAPVFGVTVKLDGICNVEGRPANPRDH
jgi:hypothetical protein